ncbi:MAG: TIGR02597 family protein [Verrucomicrobiota bacterium]
MKPTLFAFLAAVGLAHAQTAVTTPVGFVSITCLPNSDTIVGLPLRISADAVGALTANPVVAGDEATLEVANASFGAFAGTHYAKFKTSATAAGKWFSITANTTTTLTVDLNGDTLSAASGDAIEVLKFWTLSELFDPAASTTSASTTGNAIVASTSTSLLGRRSEILIPNLSGVGINLASAGTYFIHNSTWKQHGQGDANKGSLQLWPDSYIIIRHSSVITQSTTYVAAGEVEIGEFDFSLLTRTSVSQDNFVGLPRPTDTSLNNLNLGGTSAFVSSTSTSLLGRKDELLVFDNALVGRNKSAAATYFYFDGKWKRHGDGAAENRGADLIRAGSGFIIRKRKTTDGATSNWDNIASY